MHCASTSFPRQRPGLAPRPNAGLSLQPATAERLALALGANLDQFVERGREALPFHPPDGGTEGGEKGNRSSRKEPPYVLTPAGPTELQAIISSTKTTSKRKTERFILVPPLHLPSRLNGSQMPQVQYIPFSPDFKRQNANQPPLQYPRGAGCPRAAVVRDPSLPVGRVRHALPRCHLCRQRHWPGWCRSYPSPRRSRNEKRPPQVAPERPVCCGDGGNEI